MSNNRDMGSRGIYLGPLKEMQVGLDGTPRVVYWTGNEKLKGDLIAVLPLPPQAPPRQPSPQDQTDQSTGHILTNFVSPTVRLLDVALDLTIGVVIEATLSCANVRANATAGLLISGSGANATFVWNCAAQTFSLLGGPPIDRKLNFPAGASVALKMLLRTTPDGETGMAKFYANEIMSHPVTFKLGRGQSARLGVVDVTPPFKSGEPLALPVQNVKVWKMTLKAE